MDITLPVIYKRLNRSVPFMRAASFEIFSLGHENNQTSALDYSINDRVKTTAKVAAL